MTLPVGLMSLFVRKDVVETQYENGAAGFRERYPSTREDEHLFSLGAMSGGDLQLLIDELREAGLDPAGQIAIAEAFSGPCERCPGIAFDHVEPEALVGGWVARASCEPAPVRAAGHA